MNDIAWGPTGLDIYNRTYSRPTESGAETWPETVRRAVDGNIALVDPKHIREGERDRLVELIESFQLMPAGRHLWVSGVEGRQFLFNCHRAGFTRHISDHVYFVFDELMKGGGVGANYSREYAERQHKIHQRVKAMYYVSPTHADFDECDVDNTDNTDNVIDVEDDWRYHVVKDSREGWARAVALLFDRAHLGHPKIHFDFSNVRPRGSEIKGFGGTASGPGPLIDMMRRVVDIINHAEGRRLSGLEMMDVDHAIASCVIAGNVRRSARMSMMHWADPDIFNFIDCKKTNGEHWSTNISVEIDDAFFEALNGRDGDAGYNWAQTVFARVSDGMLRNGEPGFFNSSLAAVGEFGDVRCTNPCGEIALEEWENCNLGHINLALCKDPSEAAELMTRFLIRATFSDINNKLQREVVQRNRRIGVGIYGLQEWLHDSWGLKWSQIELDSNAARLLSSYRSIVDRASTEYAHELRIPQPIKTTTVAPTGTIAKLSGHTEGMHPVYARKYIRRVRYAADDPQLANLELETVLGMEPDLNSANTTVVSYLTEDIILKRRDARLIETPDEISIDDMLRVQAVVQSAWANNGVSFTANIAADTPVDELEQALLTWLPHLKGTTVLPEGSYEQAPYERLDDDEFEQLATEQAPVTFGSAEADCATGACPVR